MVDDCRLTNLFQLKEIIDVLEMSTACKLFSEKIRWALARAAMVWTTRKAVPEMASVFPDEMIRWVNGAEPNETLIWGTVTKKCWKYEREEFVEYWRALEKSYVRIFGLDESQRPSEDDIGGT